MSPPLWNVVCPKIQIKTFSNVFPELYPVTPSRLQGVRLITTAHHTAQSALTGQKAQELETRLHRTPFQNPPGGSFWAQFHHFLVVFSLSVLGLLLKSGP